MKKKFNNKCYKKAKVINDKGQQLRVLYKKVGQSPQVKIIKDIPNFKKAIILNKLDIIPYKKVFIICNNQDYKMQMPINVFFSMSHIAGDLIVINIDKNEREFKSLSQDQLLYYSKDLMRRNPNNTHIDEDSLYKKPTKKSKEESYTPFERDFDTDNSKNLQVSFEKTLISILVNIELLLANLLKNNYGDDENDE